VLIYGTRHKLDNSHKNSIIRTIATNQIFMCKAPFVLVSITKKMGQLAITEFY